MNVTESLVHMQYGAYQYNWQYLCIYLAVSKKPGYYILMIDIRVDKFWVRATVRFMVNIS